MMRLSLFSRRLPSYSKVLSWARELSAAKACAIGLGIAGVVTLLSIAGGRSGNFFSGNDTSAGGKISALPEGDENLVRAVYAAGMVQDLGTFGGYQAATTGSSGSRDFTADVANSGDASDIVAPYPAGGRMNLGASIDFNGQLWGESSLVLAATHQSFRSSAGATGGWRGGRGGARSQANGFGNASQAAPLAGAGAEASSPHSAGAAARIETNAEPSFAASGEEGDKASGTSGVTLGGNLAAALLSDDGFLGSGVGAGVPELLLAETIGNPDSSLPTLQADALFERGPGVPEVSATWMLFAAALAGFAVLRRFPADSRSV